MAKFHDEWIRIKLLKKDVSVVLGSYNRKAFLKKTIRSVVENVGSLNVEIIVVDGGSTDGSIKWLTKQKNIITIIQHNRGNFKGKPIERRNWGYFMNLGFKCAQGKYILMVSDDCILHPGAIENGFNYFEKQLNAGNKVGALAFYFREWPMGHDYFVWRWQDNKISVDHGMYLRQALAEVGWIDEESYFFYCGDSDLAFRLWHRGYEILDCKECLVEHFSHSNTLTRLGNASCFSQDQEAFFRNWKGVYWENKEAMERSCLYYKLLISKRIGLRFPKRALFLLLGSVLLLKARKIFARKLKREKKLNDNSS